AAQAAVWLAVAALAFAGTTLRAQARLAQALDPALEGRDLLVTGVVADLPQTSAIGTQFVFDVDSATWRGQPVRLPPRLALGWWQRGDDDLVAGAAVPPIRAGQRWRLPLRLRAPHGAFNPGGFDLELWYFERGLGASGSVRASGVAGVAGVAVAAGASDAASAAGAADATGAAGATGVPKAGAAPTLLAEGQGGALARWRQGLRDALQQQVPDPPAAGVLAALALGDQAAIDGPGWALFRSTGVAHLMSISGLHITMLAALAAALVARLWRVWPRLLLACPAPVAARWGGVLVAAGYAVFAGWGVPAQRTVCMLALVALLRGGGRRWPLPAVLLAAALGVTALDPWALLQPGFWLSFGAVGLLLASAPAHDPAAAPGTALNWRTRLRRVAWGGLRSQVVATVGLVPLTLLCFQQLSVVGFAANLVAIPLVTLLVTPLALIGALLPPLWLAAAALVRLLTAWLQWLAGLPLVTWSAAAAPGWAVACGLLGALVAVLPLPARLRLLAGPLMLPLLVPPLDRPAPGRFELVAADVGQGTAVLVRTHGHLLLYDAGPQTSPESDAGARVLLPLLRVRGERRIDRLLLSHGDSDHTGGAASVLAGLPVAGVISSLPESHPLIADLPPSRPHQRCSAGQAWVWDGVRFELLHPLAADHARPLAPNAMSCVLRVQGLGGSALLTGDIEAPQEAALLGRAAAALRADVLLVPHHGSRTSSTPAFIEAVQPQVAVVQAAYRSRYGHPAPAVVARYLEQGVALRRSDRCGAWTWRDGPAPGDTGRCEREAARRYWHHRPAQADGPPLASSACNPTDPAR
ncbi:MAG: DNA internalization-related competence protein ComEC/Rec2, partial [Burkholderiales bacterium]|nr:DNA internalization-related competence protein ComEC/Rec2 [Burkholderiales bacterium]